MNVDLVGDGADRSAIERMIDELGLSDVVTLHGVKTGAEKDCLIKNCDIFAHVSRWDGIPTAALEAAGLGVPLLISPQTNLGDSVKKYAAGYVSSGLGTEEITSLIKLAAHDKAVGGLNKQGRAARHMVAQEFSWEKINRILMNTVYAQPSYQVNIER